jgi:hypothetical protein
MPRDGYNPGCSAEHYGPAARQWSEVRCCGHRVEIPCRYSYPSIQLLLERLAHTTTNTDRRGILSGKIRIALRARRGTAQSSVSKGPVPVSARLESPAPRRR